MVTDRVHCEGEDRDGDRQGTVGEGKGKGREIWYYKSGGQQRGQESVVRGGG